MKSNLMENSNQAHKIILLDCDVISHFIANKALNDLPHILAPHKCVVLDYVYMEVAARPMRLAFLQPLIKSGLIEKKEFPKNIDVNKEFARIKSIYDERRCDDFISTALTYNKASFPKGVTAMRFYTPKDLSFL